MRKVIAALNMTLDGFCDHTAGIPDEEIHRHYTELLGEGDSILYGRITYQLMEFWQTILETPSKEKSMNDFAIAIDNIPKIVFSHTLKNVEWESATIANQGLKETVLATGTTGQTETLITHSENKKQTIEMIRRFQDIIDKKLRRDMLKHKVKEIGWIYAVVV